MKRGDGVPVEGELGGSAAGPEGGVEERPAFRTGGGAGSPSGPLPRDREEAVTAMFVAHHARLVGLARLLVDDLGTAEDVVQDAFAALYRRWGRLRDTDAALAYLHSAVLNGARSTLRRRRVRRLAVVPVPSPEVSAEHEVVRSEEVRLVREQLRHLPRRQREVLVLRYYLDRTEAQIAEVLGVSPGSVKTHASRGLSSLSTRLGVTS
ncbi:MAG TPA: SigE family RNA polymerase sigma factor [Jiangellales bacterium]|nr:SigE family RNA polymerase sigma factor [Jiangellales bacterium]